MSKKELEKPEERKKVVLVSTWRIILNEIWTDKRAFISAIIFLSLLLFVFIGSVIIGTENALAFDLFNMNQPPTWWIWGPGGSETGGILGTDTAGRDMFQILMVSTRNSIAIGFTVSILSIITGLIIGLIAGFYGGHVDNVIMRIIDFIIILPTTMLLITIRSIIVGFDITHLILILYAFGWQARARNIRGVTLGERVKEYVLASKTLGTPNIVIIFKKVLPNLTAVVAADVVLTLSLGVGMEVGLTALGFGLPVGTPSIGNLVANALQPINLQVRVWNWLPAIIILFIIMITINFIGQAVSRASNAQQRMSSN